jgi:hypothetical protein
MAQMLQTLQLGGQQDEQDRRWTNVSYELEQLKEQGQEPTTGGQFQALMKRHGLQPQHPLPSALENKVMQFDEYMNKSGKRGWTMLVTYEAMTQPDAPRKCDCCGTRGARMRCSNCGETYCNPACQKKEWKHHLETCNIAGRRQIRTVPPILTWEEYDIKVLGRRPSSSNAARGFVASAPTPRPAPTPATRLTPTTANSPPAGAGNNAKKNKKKREKAKAERAAASSGGVNAEKKEEEPVATVLSLPPYADVD